VVAELKLKQSMIKTSQVERSKVTPEVEAGTKKSK